MAVQDTAHIHVKMDFEVSQLFLPRALGKPWTPTSPRGRPVHTQMQTHALKTEAALRFCGPQEAHVILFFFGSSVQKSQY